MGAPEESIKAYGRSLGFEIVGITSAEPFLRDEQASIERVRQELMDGLPWYTEERVRKATHPEALLPGARSIISLATSYRTEGRPGRGTGPFGRIARYAWGDDYHEVLKRRLKEFVDGLSTRAGRAVKARIFVDAGPMNDRAAANRVLLGQVVTDLELEPDTPLAKTCGSCVRCIDACPTGAIVAPYVIHNTKCISYLTIELRGAIPRDLRPLVGDWVFGCDICQDVCPVNRKAGKSLEPAFQQRHDFSAPALMPPLELDDQGFRELFRNSPVKRAKRAGLQRNLCVALGNIGDRRAVPALVRCLGGPDALVRLHAAWALGRIGGREAEEALQSALSCEDDPEVREEIEMSLGESGQRQKMINSYDTRLGGRGR